MAPEDNPTSEPERDFVLPIVLLVEGSDSVLGHGLGPKASLYTRTGIADYWVVHIQAAGWTSTESRRLAGIRR